MVHLVVFPSHLNKSGFDPSFMNFILFPGKRQPTGTRSEQEKRRPHSQATSSAEVPPPHARRIVPVVPSSSACAVPRSAHCGAPKSPSRACLGPLPQLSATFFYIPSSSAPPFRGFAPASATTVSRK